MSNRPDSSPKGDEPNGSIQPPAKELERCPQSCSVGSRVGLITLKALLGAAALRRLVGRNYRFCADPECEVVYFDQAARSVYVKSDLRTRVGQKETQDPIPVCYCFDVTMADLRKDFATLGGSSARAMVAAEIRAGHCACEVRNPQGVCCLASLSRAQELVRSEEVLGRARQ